MHFFILVNFLKILNILASSTVVRRASQSVQTLLSELYPNPNDFIPIWTVLRDEDFIRNHETCLNYAATLDVQFLLSVEYANSIIY